MRLQSTDRLLLGIVGGAVVLVVIAVVVVLARATPEYRAGIDPGDVVFNYILAVQRGEYERAYGYLSPTLPSYPRDVQAMRTNLRRFDPSSDDVSYAVIDTQINGDQATVMVRETMFYRSGLIGGSQFSTTVTFELQRTANSWQLVSSSSWRVWAECWEWKEGC
ncbi:MAG: hypothetical protein ACK44M_14625 [Chloroflexus sp.]